MFCSSDSWDSAIVGLSEGPSGRPFIMETFYFLYGPLPLFSGVRGSGILRTSSGGALQSSHRASVSGIIIAVERGSPCFGVEAGDGGDQHATLHGAVRLHLRC